MNIAIIGAGITGSLLANKLNKAGHHVDVFEKSRGRGGRCSYKRTSWGEFDMGANVIPAHDSAFIGFLEEQSSKGVVVRWPDTVHEFDGRLKEKVDERQYYVFTPGMNAGCRDWLSGANLHTGTRIESLQELPDGWLLWDEQQGKHGPFDKLVVTAPWPQAQLLISPWLNVEQLTQHQQGWASCWSLGIGLKKPLPDLADLVYVADSPIQCLINQSSKPGSDSSSSVWVAQFEHGFSDENQNADPQTLLAEVKRAFLEIFSISIEVEHFYQHFWRYARPAQGQKNLGLITPCDGSLLVGGDWSYGGSVQAAFKAANRLFDEITRQTH